MTLPTLDPISIAWALYTYAPNEVAASRDGVYVRLTTADHTKHITWLDDSQTRTLMDNGILTEEMIDG